MPVVRRWCRGCWRSSRRSGALSGLLAALGASVAAYFLTTRWLELRYTFEWLPWLEGVLGGALLVAAGGWLATRSVVNQPPLKTLRA